MFDSSFVALIQNAALLLAAAVIFDLAAIRPPAIQNLFLHALTGFALGIIGIIVMVTPWRFAPGIVFDTRSVLIGITGLFFGWLPAVITMAMTAGFRLFLGGGGACTGVGVIVASGVIGIAWRQFRRRPLIEITSLELYIFGAAIHLTMLAIMLTLPWKTALRVISDIAIPVMLIYPVGTVLMGKLMVNRLRRKQVAEELRGTNIFLDSIFENIPNMIFIKDAQTLQFVRFNRAGEELLGYSRNDLQGKNDYDFFPQNEADFFTRKDREVLRGGEIVDIPEESIMTSGKGLRTLHTKKVPLLDDNGKPEYMLGISEDITEKKQIEAERERLLSAIEQTGEMVVVMDKEAVIQYVNPAFTSVTGYTRQEVVGQTIHILESHQQDEEFYRELWAKVSGGDTFKGRMINRRRDGSLYTEDMSISPVFNSEGNIAGYVSVGRDVTDEIRMAAQLLQAQKMEAVGRLAGGVAHDFNNMLAVILGHAEMAMNKVDPSHPSYAEFETIRKAADRSADLTRQLLAFARKQTIVPKILELNDTLEGMLKMLRRLIGEEINLVFKPGADLPPIKMDPGQIDQLLANLCLNARDAISGHGRITIETSKIALDETHCAKQEGCVPGEFVRLTVSDDGCGIARETLENIFEPFFTTKGLGRGTGLGLATVYGIVKQNRGIINVYSEPGMGSIFNIYLPACSGPDDLPQGKPQGEIPRGNGERVLLVEDEPALIKMAKDLLEMIGYVVLPSESTIEAERLAEEYAGRVDLLMTDVIMPERDGRELAKLLQSRYPGMKCLFMSGYTSDVIDRHGVLEEGMHFIQKPFSISDLAVKVKTALGKS